MIPFQHICHISDSIFRSVNIIIDYSCHVNSCLSIRVISVRLPGHQYFKSIDYSPQPKVSTSHFE